MPSLRELEQGFAAALLSAEGTPPPFAIAPPARGAERIGIYRTAVFANYRNALGATYPVLKRLVGAPFFHAAVDAFVHAHPSTSGDLNVYGDAFASFLEGYAPAAELPYLPDVARLEWAIDEASRAPDHDCAPDAVAAALSAAPPDRLPMLRLALAPSCRLVASNFPIYRIWQVNQPDFVGDDRVSLDEGAVALLVRRDWCAPTLAADAAALPPEADCSARPWGGPAALIGICVERIDAGLHAWLAALAAGSPLGAAIDAAQNALATFDLGHALRTHIATGTIAAVATD